MAGATAHDGERERRLDEILTGYLRAVDAGLMPDRGELVGRHPDLAPDVERFLADQDAFARWADPVRHLHQTPFPGGATPPGPDGLGSFGDYDLIGLIARGGMGTVFRARQRSVPRLVALKVIRAGGAATADDVRRFRNEAETVVRLDHPGVVPVYEAGERDGTLFFSMKLFAGGSLADHLGRYAADPRAAAGLAAEVARAVHHAHQRGVLHRDLKPSNVLLDEAGRPHVADFGLARRLDGDAGLTRTGEVVGTPSYMAPEQAAGGQGAVTTAADVYGLGAVLYALLSGRPPARGDTVLETLEQLKHRDPESPRLLNPRVDRDLETVCLKCLAKDPAGRYASAAELAADLDRWLAGAAVRARRAGRWERTRRWVRRRPALAALLAVTTLSAVALVAGLLWHTERLRAEAARTTRERDAARQAQRSARRAVNDMYTGVAEQWLADAPHMTGVQREFLAKALAFYEEAAGEPGTGPEDRLELGRALYRMAALRDAFADPRAESNYRASVRTLEELAAAFPGEPEYQLELARGYNRLGRFLVNTDRFPEAEGLLGRAHDQAEQLHRSDADRPEYRLESATALEHLSVLLARSGRFDEARTASVRSREHARWLADRLPAVSRYRELLAQATRGLGHVLLDTEQPGEAEQCFLQLRDLLEPLVRESPGRPAYRTGLASAWENLGALHLEAGKVTEAEEAVARSVELRLKVCDDFPDNHRYKHALASGHALHGEVLARLGRFREADDALAAALPLQEKVAEVTGTGRRREELAVFAGSLAWLHLRRPVEAEEVRKLLPLIQTARETAPQGERFRLTLLGLAYYRLGDWNRAETLLRQAADAPPLPAGPVRWTTDDPLIRRRAERQEVAAPALAALGLAMTYHRLGRTGEAMDWYRRGRQLDRARPTSPARPAGELHTIRAEAEVLLGVPGSSVPEG